MRKADIEIGGTYDGKVSGRIVPLRILALHMRGGYRAINTITGREIHVKTAARLRRPTPT